MGKENRKATSLDLGSALAEADARLAEAVAEGLAAQAARAAIDLVTVDDDAIDRLDQAVDDARRREERARERRDAIMARLGTQAANAAEAARLARRRATIASRDNLAATAPARYREARQVVLDLLADLARDAAAIEGVNEEAAVGEDRLLSAEATWRDRPPAPDRTVVDEELRVWCYSRTGRRLVPEAAAEVDPITPDLGSLRTSGSPVERRQFRRRVVVPGRGPIWMPPLSESIALPDADPEPVPPEAAPIETWTQIRQDGEGHDA